MTTVGIQVLEEPVAVYGNSPSRRSKSVGLFQCLVASTRPASRELLALAARKSGWETIDCDNAVDAQQSLDRMFLQLALVDLQGTEGQAFRTLVEQAAVARRVLLVVCGHEDDLHEEVWARQLGAWFYVPGVRESGGIGLLCRDAMTIVAKSQESLLGTKPGFVDSMQVHSTSVSSTQQGSHRMETRRAVNRVK